jgi:hypothetical protein
VFEGEDAPVPTAASRKVMLVALMLANGAGGFDWSALDLAVAMYEVENVEELLDGLIALKVWRAPGKE